MRTPNDVTLHHTRNGGRRHLRQCPELREAEQVFESDPEDTRPICVWSQKELDGIGRTYRLTIAEALEDLGAPQHARAELTRLLNLVEWERAFTTNSRSYVSLLRNDRAVAWAGKSFVDYPDRPMVLLPESIDRAGAGSPTAEGTWGDTCPACREQRSVSGACGCD